MFFEMMPKIVYDAKGAGDFNIVTNLLKRVAIRAKVKDSAIMYDRYDVIEGQRPEEVAYLLYGDAELHWVILLMNDITDVYHDWPLSTPNFLRFVNDKYDNPDAIHHWEILQSSGNTKTKIDVGDGFSEYSDTITYPVNGIYVEYSNNLYTPRAIAFEEPPTDGAGVLNGDYWNKLVTTAITNMEYEESLQDEKRNIKILDKQYITLFVDNYKELMEESII